MTRDRALALALSVPLAAALSFSWLRLLTEPFDVVDDVAYDAVFEQIDDEPTTAIAILPPWSVRPLTRAGRDAGRIINSDGPWLALADARYRRVAVVVEPDAQPWLNALPPPTTKKDIGPLALFTWELHGPARYDFRAHVDDAVVSGAGKVRRAWALVSENGSDVVVVDGACVVSYKDVELGDALVVAAGHARDGVDRGGPVSVMVKVDGDVVATLARQPSFVVEPARRALRETFVAAGATDGEGFRAEVIDLRRFGGGAHDVDFEFVGDSFKGGFAYDAVMR